MRSVEGRPINMMIYGPYGHGKTTFAASAEDVESAQDVLFINADSGTMSLTNRRNLDTIDINTYKQYARVYEYLVRHCHYRDQNPMDVESMLREEIELKSWVVPLEEQVEPKEEGRTWFYEQRLRSGRSIDEPYVYRTVMIDSLSEIHKYLVYQFTGVEIGKTKLDEDVERMEEWQVAQEMFRTGIRSFRDLRMNVIFVCAEQLMEPDRKKGRRHSMSLPKLAGQAAADVAGFIDIVGYLERTIDEGGAIRRLYLGAGYEGWISKHRFENLPDLEYLENPTFASLLLLAQEDAQKNVSNRQAQPEGRTRSDATKRRRQAHSTRRSRRA